MALHVIREMIKERPFPARRIEDSPGHRIRKMFDDRLGEVKRCHDPVLFRVILRRHQPAPLRQIAPFQGRSDAEQPQCCGKRRYTPGKLRFQGNDRDAAATDPARESLLRKTARTPSLREHASHMLTRLGNTPAQAKDRQDGL